MYDEAHEEEIQTPPEPVDLAFESLTYRLPSGRAVLRNVSGHFGHGQMSAILGPSGAGKTTLLLLLAGKIRQTSGVVRVNGRAAHMRRFRSLLGYVPEEDIMLPELTVEETLRFAVRLKLPTALSATERAAEVEHVMRLLGLLHVRHTRIGDVARRGVSFGERRRVNIAIELVGRPSVLFVDDATAGLDSTTALQVMTTLRRLAGSGVNLVTVIHQPEHQLPIAVIEIEVPTASEGMQLPPPKPSLRNRAGGGKQPGEDHHAWLLRCRNFPPPEEDDSTHLAIGKNLLKNR